MSQPNQPPPRPAGMIVLPGGKQVERTGSKYDEAEFLCGGRGIGKSGGELESITFKIHAGYAEELGKWWRAKRFPYRSMTDIVRHAVVRHLRYFLPAMEGEVDGSLINELTQIDEVVVEWKFQNLFIKHIEAIAEQVNATLALPNGRSEVERRLRVLKRKIDSTRPSFHRSVYEKMFNDRFGAYLSRIVLLDGGGDENGVIGGLPQIEDEVPDAEPSELGGDDD